MSAKSSSNLSDRQQKLLCRYFDGECSVLQYWRARKLIGCSAEARDYVRELKIIEGVVCERAEELPTVDLWSRISARIEAEECSEVLLGGRAEESRSGFFGKLGEWMSDVRSDFGSGLKWAAGGASLASACAFGLVYSGTVGGGAGFSPGSLASNTYSASDLLSSGTQGVGILKRNAISPVSLSGNANMSFEREAEIAGTDFDTGGSQSRLNRPLLSGRSSFPAVRNQAPSAFEIDWVRSEGRLHLMQDPNAKTAIIWVKPKKSGIPAFTAVRTSKRASRSQGLPSSSIPIAVQVSGR